MYFDIKIKPETKITHRKNSFNTSTERLANKAKMAPYFGVCLADSSLEVGNFMTVTLLELFLTISVVLKSFLSLLELPLELLDLGVTVLRLRLD